MEYKYTDCPYKEIPSELLEDYTMNGKIPIFEWFLDGTKKNGVIWNNDYINEYIRRFTPYNIRHNDAKEGYGNEACVYLLNAFEKYNIINKKIAVIGSESPWIEAILINLKNNVTTIEYNVPETNHENLQCKDYFTFFENNKNEFDAIVTYSSIEHSGLGRYGDPLDPNGDIKTMKALYNNLKENGLLIWAAPVGKDALSWNVHRIYGELRLPLIFENFKEIEWYGSRTREEALYNTPLKNNADHPVIVLEKC